MTATALLGLNAVVTIACFLVLWRIACRIKDASFIDSWWAIGLVVTTWVSFLSAGMGSAHAAALTILSSSWGLRLGIYLFQRWRAHGVDRRYATLLGRLQEKRGWSFAKASFWMVFAFQALVQFVVSLPVQLGQLDNIGPLGPVALAGVLVALVGIAFETIGDAQLAKFRADPANKGGVMDRGLWRYTRHPNYFGDACVWWGLYMIAAETPYGLWAFPGPIVMTFFLLSVSGIPTTEGHMLKHRPGYAEYVRRTSSFIPLPPRK